MNTNLALISLLNVLASLYQDENNQRRIVDNAGLNSLFIKFNDTAINVWHSILEEAQKRDKVEVVLEVAVQEYGDSLDLQRAELLWFANQVELTGDELTDFFHASLPKNLSKSLTANSIDQALQHLWNVVPRTTDGRLPRLEFAERLARHTPNAELAQQLRGWISRGSKHIDPMLQLENVQIMVTKVEQSIEKAAATPAYLMVVLQVQPLAM